MNSMNTEHYDVFENLLSSRNYIGAAQYLKELLSEEILKKADYSAHTGRIVEAVVGDLDSARSDANRERTVYLRSILSWLLKDYPNLSSIYREQLRNASGSADIFPEMVRGIRNVEDIISGRKTVREGIEDASEPLDNLSKQAGELFMEGLNKAGKFFAGLDRDSGSSNPADNNPTNNNPTSTETEDENTTDTRPGESA
ncbi:MAG: hypothetical protein ACR2PY_09495 [Salinispira sp.]